MIDLLVMGPQDKDKKGGVIVLFDYFLSDLKSLGVNFKVQNTYAPNRIVALGVYIVAFFRIIHPYKNRHIFLHGTFADYIVFAPFLLFARVFWGKKYYLRKFAGDFDRRLSGAPVLFRRLVVFLLKKSCANFFETQRLVSCYAKVNRQTWQWPNSRPRVDWQVAEKKLNPLSVRLLFLSQVRKDKGVECAINLVNKDESLSLDIFGPLIDYKEDFFSAVGDRVRYCGVLKAEEVPRRMVDYDALILPTYYEGEGYPGVIIEAFSVGLPVIASNWKDLPELFPDKRLLFEVRDEKDIERSMGDLIANFERHRAQCVQAFERFSSLNVTKQSLVRCGLVDA